MDGKKERNAELKKKTGHKHRRDEQKEKGQNEEKSIYNPAMTPISLCFQRQLGGARRAIIRTSY
jgi:hypothetical protein